MLREILKEFNLSEDKIEQLNKLREVCLEYNKHTNLTSIIDERDFNIKHILDSISIINLYELNNKKILDVGSGGGFPGLVLAIVLEDSEIVMLDSNNKKTKYIDHAISELGITNASTINARVEEAGISETFDVVVSRAVAALNILLEITADTVKQEGEAIYYKGSNLSEETTSNWNVVEDNLGLKYSDEKTFILDVDTERKFISFTKTSKTKEGYPRHYSQIKKKPLF